MKITLKSCASASVILALGCSTDDGSASTGDDAGRGITEALDASDTKAAAPVDAGPLWQRCTPTNAASCPSGFECFGGHTSPIDAYGLCVFSCASASSYECSLEDGTCACPETANGNAGDCSAGNAAGLVTVCVPAGDAGPTGNNQLEDAGGAAPDAEPPIDASHD